MSDFKRIGTTGATKNALALATTDNLTVAFETLIKQLSATFQAVVSQSKLLRAQLHVRSDVGYSNLCCYSWVDEDVANIDLASSTSLWQLTAANTQLNLLDVGLQEALTVYEGSIQHSELRENFLSEMTTERYRARTASHVIAWPLLDGSLSLKGMLCLEINSPEDIGACEKWADPAREFWDFIKLTQLKLLSLTKHQTTSPMGTKQENEDIPYLNVFAKQSATILISGETGTGKTRLARKIHALSSNHQGPFVAFSVIGLSPEMQLANLFGWKKGAFTGASESNKGLINSAENGTLFIDEIDKLGAEAQAGLLTLLEEKQYFRLGDSQLQQVKNIRFIVATNRNLQASVSEGEFREDLYFRINVLPLYLPSLQENPENFAHWVRELLEEASVSHPNSKSISISERSITTLAKQPWPGNLRQLDNVLRRAIAIAGDPKESAALHLNFDHIIEAVQLDGPIQSTTFMSSLLSLASDIVDRRKAGELEKFLECIKGNVLFSAIWYIALYELESNHKAVSKVINKEQSLNSRNYQKELKREMNKLLGAYESLGEQPPNSLRQLLGK